MAVTLRLARHGQKKRPFYRIVAAETESKRDGRFLDIVGTYNPMVQPAVVSLKEERVKRWISTGAQQSKLVRSLIEKEYPGLISSREENQRNKIQAKRKKRKEKLAAKAG